MQKKRLYGRLSHSDDVDVDLMLELQNTFLFDSIKTTKQVGRKQ